MPIFFQILQSGNSDIVNYMSKDVIKEGLTSLNASIIKFYDFSLFHYIHWNKACNAFSGYEAITLHGKEMLYVLNHDFCFFAYWNITKFFRSIHFALVTLIY